MAAFNPLPLMAPAASLLAQSAGTAETAVAREQAVRDRQALDADLRAQDAAARGAEAQADLSDALAERSADLQADLARQRARFAASGVSGGASRAAVFDGLKAGAGQDADRMRAETRRRLDAIRRGVESDRRRDLLELAETRRRAELAQRSAAYDQAQGLSSAGRSSRGSLTDALTRLGGQASRRWF